MENRRNHSTLQRYDYLQAVRECNILISSLHIIFQIPAISQVLYLHYSESFQIVQGTGVLA